MKTNLAIAAAHLPYDTGVIDTAEDADKQRKEKVAMDLSPAW